MEERTMVKMSACGSSVSIRAVSRKFKSPCGIRMGDGELQELRRKGRCVLRNGLNVAAMERYSIQTCGDCVKIRFIWLDGKEDGSVSGYTEQACLPYGRFCEKAEICLKGGKEERLLSMQERKRPKIEFRSLRNLKEAAADRKVRKKLVRFLGRKLDFPGYTRIVLSDDFEPYSFGFAGYTAEGPGLCGAVIYNRQGKHRDAFYGIHT